MNDTGEMWRGVQRAEDLQEINVLKARIIELEARLKDEHDWLIFYEDTSCPPTHFVGTEAHAKKILEEAGQNWTCHLYKRVASA